LVRWASGGCRSPETLADGTVRYRLKFYVGVDPETGKREFHNETFDTKREATDKAAKLRTDRAGGVTVRPSKETLSAFLKRWLSDVKEGEILPRTMYDYQNVLRRYVLKPPPGFPAIGRVRLNKLHPEHFERLYAHMRKEMGLSPRTIQYLRTILHGALDHAVIRGQIGRNPTVGVKPPRLKRQDGEGQKNADSWKANKKPEAMTKDQARAFQDAAKDDRLYPLWVLLLHTGMRPSEALGLTWPNVDLDGGRLHVRQILTRRGVEGWDLMPPKTARSERTLTLGPSIIRVLRAWKATQSEERLLLGSEYQTHGFVFATEFGAPLDQGNLNSRNFRRICEAAHTKDPSLGFGEWVEKPNRRKVSGNVKVFKPRFWTYCLRHTFATLLLQDGEGLKVVSEKLGHATEVLTLTTYSHVLPEMDARATERMEELLGQG